MIFFSSISLQDRVDFTKSLAIMLKSGITINQALTELAEQSESTRFKKVIFRVRTDIENGTPLSVAFGREEKIFGKIFVSLIKAGEESGTLQSNLQFLSDWLSRSADLNREVSAATMYPKLVFGAAVLLGGSLAVFILPKLIPLFTSLKVELPMITKMLLAISLWVQSSWLLGIFLVFFLIVGVVLLNRIHRIRKIFHFIFIHLPFMGGMLMNYLTGTPNFAHQF